MGGNSGANAQTAVDTVVRSIEKGDAKLYVDISWVNADTTQKPDIITAISKLQNTKKGDMTHRILFGSDAPLGCFGEYGGDTYKAYSNVVRDIKVEIKKAFPDNAEELINKIFYQNAQDLYFGNSSVVKSMPKWVKVALLATIAGIVVGIGGICAAAKKVSDSKSL